jgi:hypothetical protein
MATAPPYRPGPNQGFVVAMQAKLTIEHQPPHDEWIIVSRWGKIGDFLSIARTLVRVTPGMPSPVQLMPRLITLSILLRLPSASGRSTFLLAQRLPARITVAGDFVPAEGYVRLGGRGRALRLLAEGRCTRRTDRSAFRVEAVRGFWIGEFIEGVPDPEP